MWLPWWLSKESACNAGEAGLIPGLGRSPGEENGNPLQYSCLENPMDRGAWRATVHGVARVRHDRETFTFTWNPEPLRLTTRLHVKASLVAQMVKNLPATQETQV